MEPFPKSYPSLTIEPPGTTGTHQPVAGIAAPQRRSTTRLGRHDDTSLHQRQNTVESLFEASASGISTPQIGNWSAQPFTLRCLPQLSSARIGSKILVVLVGDIFPLISIDGVGLLPRDIGPYSRIFPVEL